MDHVVQHIDTIMPIVSGAPVEIEIDVASIRQTKRPLPVGLEHQPHVESPAVRVSINVRIDIEISLIRVGTKDGVDGLGRDRRVADTFVDGHVRAHIGYADGHGEHVVELVGNCGIEIIRLQVNFIGIVTSHPTVVPIGFCPVRREKTETNKQLFIDLMGDIERGNLGPVVVHVLMSRLVWIGSKWVSRSLQFRVKQASCVVQGDLGAL